MMNLFEIDQFNIFVLKGEPGNAKSVFFEI
jgi:hypothetical protein